MEHCLEGQRTRKTQSKTYHALQAVDKAEAESCGFVCTVQLAVKYEK